MQRLLCRKAAAIARAATPTIALDPLTGIIDRYAIDTDIASNIE
jgi:hypothetical protein